MAAFSKLDWNRIDVTGIVTFGGLASIDERRHGACRDWLERQGYSIATMDCRPGLAIAIPELGRLFHWEEQFGYALKPYGNSLEPVHCNLDALRDGFDFVIPENQGQVFEVIRPDLAWKENGRWLCGLLSIAMEQTRQQLAFGRRFLTLLVLPEQSPFLGTIIEEITVPAFFWSPCPEVHEFES